MKKFMAETQLRAEYAKLKKVLLDVGFVCEGSLMRVFQKCGTSSCRCQQAKKYRHGPYFLWTRKVNGKTVTRKLSKEQVPQCRTWLANNRRLNKTIRRMRQLALRAASWNQ